MSVILITGVIFIIVMLGFLISNVVKTFFEFLEDPKMFLVKSQFNAPKKPETNKTSAAVNDFISGKRKINTKN